MHTRVAGTGETAPTCDELLRVARVRPRNQDGLTFIRLRGFEPVTSFLATLAVCVIAASFAYPVLGMFYSPRSVPPELLVWAGAGAVVLATAVAVRRWRHLGAGHDDLIIDDEAAAVSLPLNCGRRTPTAVPIEQIIEVAPAEVLSRYHDVSDGYEFGSRRYRKQSIVADARLPKVDHRDAMTYAVVICWQPPHGEVIVEPIVRWSELRRANTFADWLQRRLGVGRFGASGACPEP